MDSTGELQPHTYSSPDYRDVQISDFAWTEARFLLWGVFNVVSEMVKSARFHDATVDLYWEYRMVGRFKIAANRVLSLAGGAGNLTLDSGDGVAQSNLTGGAEDTVQPEINVRNATDGDLAPAAFSPLNVSTRTSVAVSFESIAGARRLHRNDVFLTFYTALLHVAQFSPGEPMQDFRSASPDGHLHLTMQAMGTGCQVRKPREQTRIS